MPRLSIIIGCLSGVEPLEATLASVLQNRPSDSEIVVAHNGTYEDPYGLRGEVRFVETPATGFAPTLNAGCQAARGAVLHLLLPGSEVEDGWCEPALSHFDDPCVAAVAPLVLDDQDRRRVVSAGIAYGPGGGRWVRGRGAAAERNVRRRRVLGPTLAAGFFRRSTFKSVGGIDPAAGLEMADVEVALSLKARGYRALLEPASRIYGSASGLAVESSYAEGQAAERVFWRHASEVGWLSSLVLHPALVAGEFVARLGRPSAVTRLLGRVSVCLDSSESAGEEAAATTPETEAPVRQTRASIRIDPSHDQRPSRPAPAAQSRERAA